MAAVTSLIHVGHGHSNDGGLRLIKSIQLEEGSRPSFSILPSKRVVYIPTVENMLDDLIFMISVEVALHPLAIQLLDEHLIATKNAEKGSVRVVRHIEMYRDFHDSERIKIYSALKSISDLPKIVLCLFKGSTLYESVKNIRNYDLEFEVCESTMGRQYSNFSKGMFCW